MARHYKYGLHLCATGRNDCMYRKCVELDALRMRILFQLRLDVSGLKNTTL